MCRVLGGLLLVYAALLSATSAQHYAACPADALDDYAYPQERRARGVNAAHSGLA